MSIYYYRVSILFALFNAFLSQSTFAQGGVKPLSKEDVKFIAKLNLSYAMALEINDVNSAKFAMVQIVAIAPEDTMSVFKLLSLYFENKNTESAYLLSKKYCEQYRTSVKFLDFYAKSSEILGKNADALSGYEKLYLLTNDSYYGYLSANAEYFLGRYKECLSRAEYLLTQNDIKDTFVTFDLGERGMQDIVIEAALNNLIGVVLRDIGDKEGAINAFNRALKIDPEFVVAIENLKYLQGQ